MFFRFFVLFFFSAYRAFDGAPKHTQRSRGQRAHCALLLGGFHFYFTEGVFFRFSPKKRAVYSPAPRMLNLRVGNPHLCAYVIIVAALAATITCLLRRRLRVAEERHWPCPKPRGIFTRNAGVFVIPRRDFARLFGYCGRPQRAHRRARAPSYREQRARKEGEIRKIYGLRRRDYSTPRFRASAICPANFRIIPYARRARIFAISQTLLGAVTRKAPFGIKLPARRRQVGHPGAPSFSAIRRFAPCK